MDMAKTTIDYKYLAVLVARLVNNNESFTIAHAASGDTDVEVHAQMRQHDLDEWSNESHGGFAVYVDCPDVWYVARKKGHDISDSPYDAAEEILTGVRKNLETTWDAISLAIDAELANYCGEQK
jgi:hypothetical protein